MCVRVLVKAITFVSNSILSCNDTLYNLFILLTAELIVHIDGGYFMGKLALASCVCRFLECQEAQLEFGLRVCGYL